MDTRQKALLRSDLYLIALGLVAMVIGATFYAAVRSTPRIFLLPEFLATSFTGTSSMPGINALPSFLHTFAFVLMSAGVLACRRLFCAVKIALAWVLIELIFELGQHAAMKSWFIGALPAWFDAVPILDRVGAYFLHGRYDALDVAAIFIAALSAVGLIHWLEKKGVRHEDI